MSGSKSTPGSWPDEHAELLAVLPFVLAIWRDGLLTEAEVDVFRRHLSDSADIGPEATEAVLNWLDPAKPPTPGMLVDLRERVRSAAPDAAQYESLTDLGVALWAHAEAPGPWSDPAAVARLRALEDELHILGSEAAARVLGVASEAVATLQQKNLADLAGLRAFLDRDRRSVRDHTLEVIQRPEFLMEPGLGTQEYRERVLAAVRVLADEGLGTLAFPEQYGGRGDPVGSVAVFETLAYGDLSVLVKFGVQFGLFGGSIHQLGTRRHHEAYLEPLGRLELPGCYAMTETGHGSNVRDLETTATYDHAARSLIVNTPHEEAGKDWIGNAANHGRLATVFARLVVDGEDHGVHAVLVPIRDGEGTVAAGVRIEDRGLKLGLNGVDNGRIWFDRVRVPVDNLLDRFATIDEEGVYHSAITSDGRRFFTMLRTLVAGRVSIASASVAASKVGLTIAVRYASERRQFGPRGAEETPILSYLAVQRLLAPRLATTFGLHFAVRDLQARFGAAATEDDGELEAIAAGLKAYASDHCVQTLSDCRRACGGQGYLAENRFAALKADTEIFTTFEGANLVLYQLAAKGLLSRYQEEMSGLDLRGALRWLGDRAETSLTELNPLITRRTDEEHLLDPAFHQAALAYRRDRLLRSVALRVRARLRDGMDSFLAINAVQDHLIDLARANIEATIAEHFDRAVAAAPTPGVSEALRPLAALFALSTIEADRGWFLESGYLEPAKSRAIRGLVNDLCAEVSELAPELVNGFSIPETLLPPFVAR